MKHGCRAKVYASRATCALAAVLRLDTAHRQEEDARRALDHLVPRPPGRARELGDVTLQLGPVGHMLGACAVPQRHRGERVMFSGDVSRLAGLSGHADADELIDGLRGQPKPPRRTFVVHGEPEASDTLRLRIADELGWQVSVPQHGETVEL